MKKQLKVIELFGGIGACSSALTRLGIDYKIVDYVEIDKYAVKSFNAIHGTNFEPQDICKWDKDVEVDLIMHGSPCQDFSLAGKQAGGDKDSGTRSSLMYETIRIVEKLKPKYVIWENVKNLLSKKHRHNFDAYLETMEQLGYTNYYQVLNAKDYGIPQNRERVFTVSILGNEKYEFPKGEENNNKIDRLFNFSARQDCRVVYDENGLSPTLVAGMGAGGGKVPMFIEKPFEFPPKQLLKLKLKDMLEDEVDDYYYNVCPSMIKALEEGKVKNVTNLDYCNTLTTKQARWNNAGMIIDKKGLRYLSGIETWRLMGFDDEDYKKASLVCPLSQLYKQAGNSIVVNVLEAIFDNLLQEYKCKKGEK